MLDTLAFGFSIALMLLWLGVNIKEKSGQYIGPIFVILFFFLIKYISVTKDIQLSYGEHAVSIATVVNIVFRGFAAWGLLVTSFLVYVMVSSYLSISKKGYSLARGSVYFNGHKLKDADAKSFRTWTNLYQPEAMDANHLYLAGYPFYKINQGEKFTYFDTGFGTAHWFVSDLVIIYATVPLECLNQPGAAIEAPDVKIIKRSESSEVKKVEGKHTYLKDANHVYYNGEIVTDAKPEYFKYISDTSIATDGHSLFFEGSKVAGVDAQHFQKLTPLNEDDDFSTGLPSGGEAFFAAKLQGNTFIHYGFYRVPVINPDQFVVLNNCFAYDGERLYYCCTHQSKPMPNLKDIRIEHGDDWDEFTLLADGKQYQLTLQMRDDNEFDEMAPADNQVNILMYQEFPLKIELKEIVV